MHTEYDLDTKSRETYMSCPEVERCRQHTQRTSCAAPFFMNYSMRQWHSLRLMIPTQRRSRPAA